VAAPVAKRIRNSPNYFWFLPPKLGLDYLQTKKCYKNSVPVPEKKNFGNEEK
jgi:hypothetical protein